MAYEVTVPSNFLQQNLAEYDSSDEDYRRFYDNDLLTYPIDRNDLSITTFKKKTILCKDPLLSSTNFDRKNRRDGQSCNKQDLSVQYDKMSLDITNFSSSLNDNDYSIKYGINIDPDNIFENLNRYEQQLVDLNIPEEIINPPHENDDLDEKLPVTDQLVSKEPDNDIDIKSNKKDVSADENVQNDENRRSIFTNNLEGMKIVQPTESENGNLYEKLPATDEFDNKEPDNDIEIKSNKYDVPAVQKAEKDDKLTPTESKNGNLYEKLPVTYEFDSKEPDNDIEIKSYKYDVPAVQKAEKNDKLTPTESKNGKLDEKLPAIDQLNNNETDNSVQIRTHDDEVDYDINDISIFTVNLNYLDPEVEIDIDISDSQKYDGESIGISDSNLFRSSDLRDDNNNQSNDPKDDLSNFEYFQDDDDMLDEQDQERDISFQELMSISDSKCDATEQWDDSDDEMIICYGKELSDVRCEPELTLQKTD